MQFQERAARCETVLHARLNSNGDWQDVKVLNVSAKGLMVKFANPIKRGDFVEVRRQRSMIIAQVRWASHDRAGLLSQDQIDLAAFKNAETNKTMQIERRSAQRNSSLKSRALASEIASTSLRRSRIFEFASIAVAASAFCYYAAETAYQALERPLAKATLAMASTNLSKEFQ